MVWKNDQVSELETGKIIELARKCFSCEGDLVELGCYKGDTSLLLAEVLKGSSKKLWIYDSFEGLPGKHQEDESTLGVNFREGELFVTKREVKERFLRAGLPVPVIKKAWFSDLTEADLPEKIALAFLDGDFYKSIRDSLKIVEGKMSEGAIIMIHDYNNPALPGVAKATDSWLADKQVKTEIYRSMLIVYL